VKDLLPDVISDPSVVSRHDGYFGTHTNVELNELIKPPRNDTKALAS